MTNLYGVLHGQMAKVEQRDCPKRVGGACSVALQTHSKALFALRVPDKSTL
jgi:hypothetical protein